MLIFNILIAFLCQITLFVSKIWPLVQKKTLQRLKALQKHCHFYLLAHYHNVSQNNSTQKGIRKFAKARLHGGKGL